MLRLLPIIILSVLCFCACSKQEEAPQQFSSSGLRMNGSRFISDIGIPTNSASLEIGKKDTANPITAPPIPIMHAGNFEYVLAQGKEIVLGNEKNTQIIASLPSEWPIIQLLTDEGAIYSVQFDGKINAFDHSGKVLWNGDLHGLATPYPILAQNLIIGASDSGITVIDNKTGKTSWTYHNTGTRASSIIYDERSKLIIEACSPTLDEKADSILCFTLEGIVKSRCGFANMRIISNLCICGKDRDLIAFGYLVKPMTDQGERTIHVGIFSGIEIGDPKKISDHEVPYLPTSVASNGPIVFSSGFREAQGDMQSGIDAFNTSDTSKLWQRRFTYPIFMPPAVSNKYVFFSLSFATEALVPAQTIFYTLDAHSGKALGELAVPGAKDGFGSTMAMPFGDKGLMVSDRSRSTIYFLKP